MALLPCQLGEVDQNLKVCLGVDLAILTLLKQFQAELTCT